MVLDSASTTLFKILFGFLLLLLALIIILRPQYREKESVSDLPDSKYAIDFKKWNLVTIKDIKEGEELTVRYTFYNI